MKLSARNQIRGTVTEVIKGATTSHVRIDIGGGTLVTASIPTPPLTNLNWHRESPPMPSSRRPT